MESSAFRKICSRLLGASGDSFVKALKEISLANLTLVYCKEVRLYTIELWLEIVVFPDSPAVNVIVKNLGDVLWEIVDVLALIELDMEQGVS